MEVVCKRYTEIPHTSRLFSDLLYHFDRVGDLYPYPPFSPASYTSAAAAIDYSEERRAGLVQVLEQQNGSSLNLSRLSKPGAVAVVTGQQVGLFSGPAYTIYKALTAVRLARQLTQSGIEAVPVFWLATEDHDLPEISSCWTFNLQNEPLHLQTSITPNSTRPVGNIEMQDLPIGQLQDSLRAFPHGEEIATRAAQAYQPGKTYGEAFRALLGDLLSRHGLLFFDPMHPGARKLAAPFLAKAVDAAPELTRLLLERNHKLAAAGYHAQVHIEPHTSLFFLLENGERIALRRKDSEYHHKNGRISAADLRERAECLSPNAALRPVVQDYMIPTVAYIGGPAELAYLSQSAVIYQSLLGRMPVAVPRNAFTLLDPRSRKLMERYHLHLDSFFPGEEHLHEAIAAKLVPPAVKTSLDAARSATTDTLARLRQSLQPFDSTLGQALDKSAAKMNYQMEKMERKIRNESLRRSQRAQQEARSLFNLLYPHKHLQERFYTILPFLAHHGMELLDTLHDHTLLDCPDHHILYL